MVRSWWGRGEQQGERGTGVFGGGGCWGRRPGLASYCKRPQLCQRQGGLPKQLLQRVLLRLHRLANFAYAAASYCICITASRASFANSSTLPAGPMPASADSSNVAAATLRPRALFCGHGSSGVSVKQEGCERSQPSDREQNRWPADRPGATPKGMTPTTATEQPCPPARPHGT